MGMTLMDLRVSKERAAARAAAVRVKMKYVRRRIILLSYQLKHERGRARQDCTLVDPKQLCSAHAEGDDANAQHEFEHVGVCGVVRVGNGDQRQPRQRRKIQGKFKFKCGCVFGSQPRFNARTQHTLSKSGTECFRLEAGTPVQT